MVDEEAGEKGLVLGFLLDGKGGGRRISRAELDSLEAGPEEDLWLHWDRSHPEAQAWLRERSDLSEFTCDLLLEEETRPRLLPSGDQGVLLFLRGVNLNPGADPEDMVSLRVHGDSRRVISLRLRPLRAIDQIRQDIERGEGPRNSSELLLQMAFYLTSRVDELNDALSIQLDALEERLDMDEQALPDHGELLLIRRRAAGLKRYLAPQREIFAQLARQRFEWFSTDDAAYWNELHNSLTRNLEELEMSRERVAQLESLEQRRLGERTNKTMFLLTIVTVFFLPLSFFTGLLGINVGGMPGADNPQGFLWACALSALIAVGQWLVFRWLRWL
ncbi:zinc transporter ZntB [Pseudomonas matsuisoli]|uniref:Transporter n=1 Tax=Pseudomonas matsuisoli TaxID=1515666 RepID=A0A917Q1B9_9PSED|nr:zinc transporter ZntB [Pseudomonas matsuisoli]GGK06060.1 transporter [Pseudomonas matsuisoli]